MNYSSIRYLDISNAPGMGVSLFCSGCYFRCDGCHNSNIWDPNSGKHFSPEDIETILKLIEPKYIKHFALLGGEPLEPQNLQILWLLLNQIHMKKPELQIWVYTGYTLEELMKRVLDEQYLGYILELTDYLVDGRYEKDKRDVTLAFRGSSNQKIWDIKKMKEVTSMFDNGEYE